MLASQVTPDDVSPLASIVIVDDDLGTREIFSRALIREGYRVRTADSGTAVLGMVHSARFDLFIIDLKLPDMLGTDVIRQLQCRPVPPKVLVISGFLTIEHAVSAMKLGALDVLEKPIDVDVLVSVVRRTTKNYARLGCDMDPVADGRAGCPADRWALFVLKAVECRRPLSSIAAWAEAVDAGASSIRETCRLLHIAPHDARDFARVLRAVFQSIEEECPLDALLDVADRRTLNRLLDRAGLRHRVCRGPIAPQDFLRSQRFVPYHHPGLRALSRLLNSRGLDL